jgi:long-chain acyl-CoA synthetase
MAVIDTVRLAARFGDRVALRDAQGAVSYADLAQLVAARAGALRAAGISAGTRVVLACAANRDTVMDVLALLEADCMTIPVGGGSRPDELAAAVERCDARWLVAGGEARDANPSATPRATDSAAVLGLLSSGSTGTPKLVLRDAGQVRAGFSIYAESVDLSPNDRVVAVLPFEHSYGYNNVILATLDRGATMVLPPSAHPRAVAEAAARESATILPAAPVFFDLTTRFCGDDPGRFSSLRVAVSAGTALSRRIHEAFTSAFAVPLWQSYGASEAGPACLNRAGIPDGEMLALGGECAGVEVMVSGDDGAPAPEGVTGELVIRSPAVALGYDTQHDGASRFEGGAFFTGDLGCRREGVLYFAGRRKLLIAAAGHKVDPVEVEAVLRQHPQVADCAVVGHRAGDGFEVVKALVVARGKLGTTDLMDFCAGRLSAHKVPRLVEFRESLPRNAMGKLQMERL